MLLDGTPAEDSGDVIAESSVTDRGWRGGIVESLVIIRSRGEGRRAKDVAWAG
jgi:hypothetical protein